MVLKYFMSRSTAHGLLNIAKEESICLKIMWLILTLAVVAGFTFHTTLMYKQLLEDQVSSSVQPNSIPFLQPDIVFCSEKFLARDIINNPPANEYEYMNNVSNAIQELDKWYRNLTYKSSIFIWDNLNIQQIFKAFYHRREEFFMKITCNAVEVNVDDITVEMNFVYLACYRLTPKICNLTSPMTSLIIKFYNHIYGINISYTTLNVNIDGRHIDTYLFAQKEQVDEMEDGVNIYFVQPNELIHISTNRINASPNEHTDIRIRSLRSQRVPTSKFKCQKYENYVLAYNLLEENIGTNPLNFTESSSCIHIGFQYIIQLILGCVSTQYPILLDVPSNFTFCGMKLKNTDLITYATLLQKSSLKTDTLLKQCSDKIPCTTIKYSTSVGYSNWPRSSTLRTSIQDDLITKITKSNLLTPGMQEMLIDFSQSPSDIAKWKVNVMKVTITPDEYMSSEVIESQSYSLKNFFCDAGGILGFYMGASLLTLCEVFRLTQYLVNHCIQRRYNGKRHESHEL